MEYYTSHTSNSNKKIIVASTVFLTLLISTSWGIYHYIQSNNQNSIALSNQKETKNTTKLFYKSIGATPTLNYNKNIVDSKSSSIPRFTLELATVNDTFEAKNALKEYAQKGITAYYTPVKSNGRVFYKIRSGFFESKQKAYSTSTHLKKVKGINTDISKL